MALGGGGESGTCEKLRRISAARLTGTPVRMTAREGGKEGFLHIMFTIEANACRG